MFDQTLGGVGGNEAPESTGASLTDESMDTSSEERDVDVVEEDEAVDSDAAGSAQVPVAGPSVPAGSAHTISTLPNEMLASIIASVDPIGHHSLRLTSKALRASVDTPPLMSREEYVQFNRGFEAHSARKPKTLLCPHCNVFKKSTASKTTFSDAQAAQNLNGRRACIDCGIANGHYDRRDLVIKKKKLFVCGGCKLILTHDKEEGAVQDVVITKAFPYRDYAHGMAAEITFDDGEKRWCRQCRMVIAGLGEGRTMKVKQVRAT